MDQNICNPQIAITVFDNHHTPTGARYCLDWATLYHWLLYYASLVSSRDAMRLIKLAIFENDYRENKTLQLVYGIEGDYDAGNVTVSHVIEILHGHKIESYIYTTSRHTEANPRFRILCIFSKPVLPQERHKYVAYLNGSLGGILASESFTDSQSFYVGSALGGHPMQCYHVQGAPIDLIEGLPSIGPKEKEHFLLDGHGQRINGGKIAQNYKMALDALRSADPGDGDRKWWLKISGAFFTATKGLVDDQIALEDWQAWNTSYGEKNNPHENIITWKDFTRRGTNGDFVDLAKMSNNPAAQVYAYFGDTQFIDPESFITNTTIRSDFYFTRADHLKNEIQEYLIEQIIPVNSICLFFGQSGSGKTFGALSIGMSLASGISWYGNNVKRGAVLYICGEGRAGIIKRLQAWVVINKQRIDGIPFYMSSASVDFSNSSTILQVDNAIKKLDIKPALIIIDTLSRNISGDENDSKEMAAFIKALDNLKDKYGASILLVHHTGHSEKDRARGSSVLKAAMDSEFRFDKADNKITFTCTKMKDLDAPKPKIFELKSIPIFINNFPYMGAALVPADSSIHPLSPQSHKSLTILQKYNEGITKDNFLKCLVNERIITGETKNHRRSLSRIIEDLTTADKISESPNGILTWTERTN